jgi:hypothetical protein
MMVRDAVLGWARAVGVYSRYGGVPCEAVRAIGGAGAFAGVPWEDMERAYSEGCTTPTPYLMGWVARILAHDPEARMDMRAPIEELGRFDVTSEYERGWQDSWEAALVIMQMRGESEDLGLGGD